MSTLLTYLTLGALIATAIVLFMGLGTMFFNKEGNEERSNKLMRWRVLLQMVALGLFALLLLSKRKVG